MTLQNCFENRRWAVSLMNQVLDSIKTNWTGAKIEEYWYLKNWIDEFDRLVSIFTCWPEHHDVYQRGFSKLKELSKSL